MATSTTNLGLIKPAGTDKIRIAQINQNSDTLDAAIGPVGATSLQTQMNNVQDALAIIANGDTHPAITAGQYVYVKNNTHSVAEGLHVATANISANGQITTSNVSADASGGLNALNAKITGAFCSTAEQVISALDNAVSTDGNTVISIVNSSKNDIFTAATNQTMVVVHLNEESGRWNDHPYFIIQAENGLWTGRVGKQSGAWAIQEIYELALNSDSTTRHALSAARSGDTITGNYIQFGKIVVVDVAITLNAAAEVNTAIISGVPSSFNVSSISGFKNVSGERGTAFYVRTQSNTLITNAAMQAGTYIFSGSYIAS